MSRSILLLTLVGGAVFYYFYTSSRPAEGKKISTDNPNVANNSAQYNESKTLQNLQTETSNLTAKQQSVLQVLQDGYIPVNSSGAIIADTIYQGKPRKSQEAFEQNIQLKYGEATPIERTADPLTSVITLVGGQKETVGRSPSSDAEKYQARRANLSTFSEADKQTESYKKADAKLKALGY